MIVVNAECPYCKVSIEFVVNAYRAVTREFCIDNVPVNFLSEVNGLESECIVCNGKFKLNVKHSIKIDEVKEKPFKPLSVAEFLKDAKPSTLMQEAHEEFLKEQDPFLCTNKVPPCPYSHCDENKQLMWEEKTEQTRYLVYDWQDAFGYIGVLNRESYLGYNDWRLPTVKELVTIVDYKSVEPAVDKNKFPCINSAIYWSSTPDISCKDEAWSVSFIYGDVHSHVNKKFKYHVIAVRG